MPIILGKRRKNITLPYTKDKDIKGLLLAIDGYTGDYSTKMALKVLPYVFVRSFNIRHMEWNEIDFKTKEWVIPAKKMKTKIEFTLPLPQQVIDLFLEVKENTTSMSMYSLVQYTRTVSISDNTLIVEYGLQ